MRLGRVLADEPLDGVPLVVHDAVDAEVQVCAVELEQLAQQVLEFPKVSFAGDGLACHGVIPPSRPRPPSWDGRNVYPPARPTQPAPDIVTQEFCERNPPDRVGSPLRGKGQEGAHEGRPYGL